jgi:predicted DNA-binding protein
MYVFGSTDAGIEDTEWWYLADDARRVRREERKVNTAFDRACWALYARDVFF